ncbi:hypothetical protein [Aneurinibacillus migulanus]|uniref:Uncharacterized protein n=1 Tax=Aneurinibacillus migulanus TaxID=47500 RepID=A0A0D1WAG3_ANEMI|nr:hypothetical protein [Aneurinibacillus migulanus]KIV55515.1 hypothetical protein TS65_15770 [Aneurinibacillus migulanus]KON90937.1 hypothetical protein AF333_28520 [Aneurinibacillus migulanus]MED0894137.1 hypothetical protein [Aneurinibacillus migulanus]MED1619864.1 hypothetical protein [Aneurinibacillus migulanus]GED18119.1 hypothetical protein AMI01nite_61100 [Aneurinibacillus migulanus]
MISSIEEFLRVARINRVICVDDDNNKENGNKNDGDAKIQILKQIAVQPSKYLHVLKEAGLDLEDLLEFSDDVQDRIAFLKDFITDEVVEATAVSLEYEVLSPVLGIVNQWKDANLIRDYKVIGSVKKAKEFLEKLPQEWEMDSDNRVLWLIDRDFSKANEGKDAGFELIKEIGERKLVDNICLLVTANTEDICDDELRRSVYKNHGLLEFINLASVVTKSNVIDDEKKQELLDEIIHGLWNNYNFHLISNLTEYLSQGLIDSKEKILSLSSPTIRHIILKYPELEGTSVGETVFRILLSLVTKEFGNRYSSNLEEITKLLIDYKTLEKQIRYTEKSDNEILFTLRKSEKYDDNINILRQAINFGDIFLIDNKYYILLSQPCDIAYRKKNGRKVDRALLVRMKPYDKEVAEKNPKYYSEVIKFFNNEEDYWLDFRNFRVIDFNILDLCTLSTKGYARVDKETLENCQLMDVGEYDLLPYDKKWIEG